MKFSPSILGGILHPLFLVQHPKGFFHEKKTSIWPLGSKKSFGPWPFHGRSLQVCDHATRGAKHSSEAKKDEGIWTSMTSGFGDAVIDHKMKEQL